MPGAIACREWDDELVVYNDANGSTHHLAPLGGKVLQTLLGRPAGIDMPALTRLVADAVGIADADILAPNVEETLAELAGLHLVACDTA